MARIKYAESATTTFIRTVVFVLFCRVVASGLHSLSSCWFRGFICNSTRIALFLFDRNMTFHVYVITTVEFQLTSYSNSIIKRLLYCSHHDISFILHGNDICGRTLIKWNIISVRLPTLYEIPSQRWSKCHSTKWLWAV